MAEVIIPWAQISGSVKCDKDGIVYSEAGTDQSANATEGEPSISPAEETASTGTESTTTTETAYPEPELTSSMDSADESVLIANDSVDIVLDSKNFRFADSKLVIPDVVVAKAGVQKYGNKLVLKDPEELKKAVRFMDSNPITIEHPKLGIVSEPNEINGFVRNPRFNDSKVIQDFEVDGADLIKLMQDEKGPREVSLGFNCKIVKKPGVYNDQKYDYVQTNILPNHTAVVQSGRCSLADGCGIKAQAKTINQISNDAAQVKKVSELEAKAKQLDELMAEKKTELIGKIMAITDSIPREQLDKMTVCDLTNEHVKIEKIAKENKSSRQISADALTRDSDPQRLVEDVYNKSFNRRKV
jgi:hypothetical protein